MHPKPPDHWRQILAGVDLETFDGFLRKTCGINLHPISWHGRTYFAAAELGSALQYANDGRGLPDIILRGRKPELAEGDDYQILCGPEVEQVQGDQNATCASLLIRHELDHLVLLTPSGVFLAIVSSRKRLGGLARHWLQHRSEDAMQKRLPSRSAAKLEKLLEDALNVVRSWAQHD